MSADMVEADTYTVAVFQDADWARRGIAALLEDGFAPSTLTILAKDSPETHRLCDEMLGGPGERIELRGLGTSVARGSLVAVLQGADNALATGGIGGTITRAGFQRHDGHIFETLASRGGVLVAVRDARRAADALAKMHSYGGGNAAIGAWSGRV
jgi:hypothetical protein